MARFRAVVWVGSSLKDVHSMPEDVKDMLGFILRLVQQGVGSHLDLIRARLKRAQEASHERDR